MKAAKALKEKGETPEELLRSIKENEKAVAEAQREVDAWKAIVGEKSRREEAAKEEAEKRMDDEEPKPVGSGVFGNIYNQFKGKVKEAFDFLMKHKGGDLLGVFHRKDVGDIDLVWGDENAGKNDFEDGDKIVFRKGSELVTVRKNFREGGKKTGF